MEKMAIDVKECIEQAKFNGRHVEVHRGVSCDTVFDDDDELKQFLNCLRNKNWSGVCSIKRLKMI